MQTTARKILGDFGEVLEKAITDQAKATGSVIKSQLTPFQSTVSTTKDTGIETTSMPLQHGSLQATRDPFTEEFLRDIYGPSDNNLPQHHGMSQQHNVSEFVQQKIQEGMSPEDAQKLESLRKKLHDEVYYQPLIQRKSHEQEQKEKEQKEEEEKVYKMKLEEEEKKKNEVPLAVQMASQRAERFPGASG